MALPKKTLSGPRMVLAGVTALIAAIGLFTLFQFIDWWAWFWLKGIDDFFSGTSAVFLCAFALWSLTEGPGADEFRRLMGRVRPMVKEVKDGASSIKQTVKKDTEERVERMGWLPYFLAVAAFYSFGHQIIVSVYEVTGASWFDRAAAVPDNVDEWGFVLGVVIGLIAAIGIAVVLERQSNKVSVEAESVDASVSDSVPSDES